MPLKAVFFDLDGTLLDTHKDLGNALNQVRQAEGLAPLPFSAVKNHVSNGANALVTLGFGAELSAHQHRLYRQHLLTAYLDNIAQHTGFYAGIELLLAQLTQHNVYWGIVTNKPKVYTDALLPELTFAKQPDVVVCPEDAGIAKPDPAPLLHACNRLDVSPDECVFIGDHLRDIECGHNAGMRSIAVGYGYIDADDSHLDWNATYTANTPDDLWPIINTLIK